MTWRDRVVMACPRCRRLARWLTSQPGGWMTVQYACGHSQSYAASVGGAVHADLVEWLATWPAAPPAFDNPRLELYPAVEFRRDET